jgi:hypothetical protein
MGGVAVAGVVGVQHPAEVGVHAVAMVGDLGLGPRVLAREMQVDVGVRCWGAHRHRSPLART